jgi:hypothetical protein
MDQEKKDKYAEWVMEIAHHRTVPSQIRDSLLAGESGPFLEFLEEQIILQMRDVNAMRMSNPARHYGRDYKIPELEDLKKVLKIVASIQAEEAKQ